MPTNSNVKTGRRATNRRRGTTSNTRTSSSRRTSRGTTSTGYSPTQFRSCQQTIEQRIGSYRNIKSQVSGSGKVTAFSPTICNRWINYVNQGCCVYKFSNPQFCQKFGTMMSNCTPSQALRQMQQKFGTGVKAVTRGKGNCWLVACSPRVNARPFSTYNWK